MSIGVTALLFSNDLLSIYLTVLSSNYLCWTVTGCPTKHGDKDDLKVVFDI